MAANAELTLTGDGGPDSHPAADHFCAVCCGILQKTEILDMYARKPRSRETKAEQWAHQANEACLIESAQQGCHLCALLLMQCSSFGSDRRSNLPSGLLTFEIRYDGDLRCGMKDVKGNLDANCLSPCYLSDEESNKLETDKEIKLARRTVSTASDATLALAQAWLNECRSTHKECSERGFFPLYGPRRLLKLSRSGKKIVVRLFELSHWTKDIEYLTLSHCWGSGVPLKLTLETHKFFLQNVPVHDLPRTFQDAVDITLRLGYRYLWVDALCILQDDTEDWSTEAQAMGYIYGNSVCTIAALAAPDSSSGCYGMRSPLAHLPCKIQTTQGNVLYLESARSSGLRSVMNPHNMGNFDSPVLHSRGWVVQERVLSPRTLYYSPVGIYWECCNADVSEYSEHTEIKHNHSRSFSTGRLKLGISQIFRNHRSFGDFWASKEWHPQWWHLIEIYTGCNLTYSRDRWNAVSGIASMFTRVSGSSSISGLWRDLIGKDMLWETSRPSQDRLDNGMPSWSWLSINGKVRLNGLVVRDHTPIKNVAEIVSLPPARDFTAQHHTLGSPPWRHYIRIRAPLMRSHIRELPNGAYSDGCWVTSGPLDVMVRNSIELGKWLPDFTNIDKMQDIWALHWTNENTGLHGLIVKPFTEEKRSWYRIGQFHVGHAASVEKKALGEMTIINLC